MYAFINDRHLLSDDPNLAGLELKEKDGEDSKLLNTFITSQGKCRNENNRIR